VVIDMGPFEVQGIPVDVTFGDVTGDGTVGMGDLLAVLAAWGPAARGDCALADLDLDGEVVIRDLLIQMDLWE
jgi:hypothetical protein